MIILLSGLQSIDTSLYEAGSLDGAGRIRQLWSITVPLLRRSLMFCVVLQTLAVFQMFAEPYVVTKEAPTGRPPPQGSTSTTTSPGQTWAPERPTRSSS
ncbi:carbohydrate ABC transporter permease [Leifsonia sp. L25]|uniref:carbohydrate ABC transporter permease n=1 Tax=Leifsonia sp. L25 TaxID=3423957 RepID=UPI003D6835C6